MSDVWNVFRDIFLLVRFSDIVVFYDATLETCKVSGHEIAKNDADPGVVGFRIMKLQGCIYVMLN